jgi:DnaK suppressor protein
LDQRGSDRVEGSAPEGEAMEEIRQRLEMELNQTMERIRQLGGAVVIEEFSVAVGDNTSLADEADVISLTEDREMNFVTRSMLVERANKLTEALDRLRDTGYGICEECNEPIAAARLRVMPEATTCVRCQDRLERTRRLGRVLAGFSDDELDE